MLNKKCTFLVHKVKSFLVNIVVNSFSRYKYSHSISGKITKKFIKVSADIRYIKTCKKEQLIPTFARVNVSLKDVSFKLRKKIDTLIMETEIQNKHLERRKLRKQIRKIRTTLKRGLNLIILNTVFHQLNLALKSKFKAVTSRHQKKLSNLRKKQKTKTMESKNHHIKNTVQNFSLYKLLTEENTALIPTRLNNNIIHTEFEQFYQGILNNISHIPENYLSSLKTKLRNTCKKYNKIRAPYKYKKIIDQLSRNKYLCILKQGKGRGAVLMGRAKYTSKCLEMKQISL